MTVRRLAVPARLCLILALVATLCQPKEAWADNCLQFCLECGIDCSRWCGGPCSITCGSSGDQCSCSFHCDPD